MAKNRIITGLDIGTASIKSLVVGADSKEKELELLFKSQEVSRGVRRGTVVSAEEVSIISRNLISRAEQDLGERINSVYVNLGGSHIFSTPSRGLISVSRADKKISREDIQRVLNEAKAINLSSNKRIFDVLAKEYIIDGVNGIKDADGLEGVRLEVEALALGGFAPYIENVKQAVLGSDLAISDMIPSALAAARATIDERQRELGVALLDIGAGISSLAVFEEGSLIHLAVLPMGSINITIDIAIGLQTDFDIAERIKIEYGSCQLKGKDVKRKIDIGEKEPLVFQQKFLTKIISSRISEIFDEVSKELKKISKERLLPSGIVLTGGGVKLPKIIDLAKGKLRLPISIGIPKGIHGLEPDPALATVCGLVMSGSDLEGRGLPGVGEELISKFKKLFKTFIP